MKQTKQTQSYEYYWFISVQHNYVLIFFPPGLAPLYCDFLFLVLVGSLWCGFLVLFGGPDPGPGPGPGWRDSAVPENILITKKIQNNALNIHLVLSSYQTWRCIKHHGLYMYNMDCRAGRC
jgi:hypothetical protein